MAIRDKDEQKQTGTVAQQQPAQAGGETLQNVRRGRLTRNVTKSRTGDNLMELFEAFKKQLVSPNAQNADYSHRVIALDAKLISTHFSALAVTAELKVGNRNVVTVATMLVGGSNAMPAPVRQQIAPGQFVDQIIVAGDAWDKTMWDKVQEGVKKQTGQTSEIINAGCFVLPPDYDSESESQIHDTLWAAADATASVLEQTFPEEFGVYNVATSIEKGNKLVASWTDGYASEVIDEVGLPVRSDLSVKVVSTHQSNNNWDVSAFQHNSSEEIATAAGYVDLVREYRDPNQPVPHGVNPNQQFRPRLVVTKLSSGVLTPETAMLALANFFMIGENYNWANRFQHSTSKMDDIGALGYLIANPVDATKPPARIDTKSNSFGLAEFADLITNLIAPAPAFSIDCQLSGPDSWLTNTFIAAAEGGANSPANKALIAACNNLTNGAFAQYWNGDAICALDQNTILLGTYVNDSGEVNDIRDIDNLAVLSSVGNNAIGTYHEWCTTFDAIDLPRLMRLDQRYQIMRKLSVKSLTIRDKAERVNINPAFPGAMLQALAAVGYRVEVQGLTPLFNNNNQQGNRTLGQYAVQSGYGSAVQYQGGGYNTAAGAQGFRPMNRW